MIIKTKTTDLELSSKFSTEALLVRFAKAKAAASKSDTERDRLRKFIQQHVASGRYGDMILDKTTGSPRVYVNSAGNEAIQSCIVIDTGIDAKLLKGGTEVTLVHSGGTQLQGSVVDNETLYSRKASVKLTLMEVPNDPGPATD